MSALEIDRSFVAPLGTEAARPAIVKAIVTLAQALGLRVIAEGGETEAQLSELRTLGCELAQGHYFARPLPAGAATGLPSGPASGSDPVSVR